MASTWSPMTRYAVAIILELIVAAIFGGYSTATNAALKGEQTSPLAFALLRDVIASTLLQVANWSVELRRGVAPKEEHDGNLQQPQPRAHDAEHGRYHDVDQPRKSLSEQLLTTGDAAPEPALRSGAIAYEDTGYFVLLGVLGVFGAQGLSAIALKYTTAAFFGCVSPLQPVVALVVALSLGMEPWHARSVYSWGKLLGVAVSVAGAALLVASSSGHGVGSSSIAAGSSNLPLGVAMCALQILMGGCYSVASRRMLDKYSALTTTAWTYTLGTMVLSLSVLVSATDASDWSFTPAAGAAIIFAGVCASALNYFLMSVINNLTSPVFVSACMVLNAVFTCLFSYAFLGQSLGAADVGFIAIVVTGLLSMIACQFAERQGVSRLS